MDKKSSRRVKWIYAAALFLSLHYAFTLYINSNFLSLFFSARHVGLLYTIGSLITIALLVISPSLVRTFGNARMLLAGIALETVALLGLFFSSSSQYLTLFFLMHQALPPLLLYGLDIFLEDTLRTENITGRVRSMYMTVVNFAFVISPLIVGYVISLGLGADAYRPIYLISAVFCFILFFIVGDELGHMRTKTLEQASFRDSVRKILPKRGLRIVIFLDLLLQSFYAFMVIYIPIYLHQVVGFDWETIGVLFTVMLVPFVLFEAPLGRIFDKRKIELDTIVAGFAIMILSLVAMAFLHSSSVLLWGALLFISRIGASFVEVGNEFSFFRRVTGRDAGFISLFRMTSPLSYVLVPLIIGSVLIGASISALTLCLGVVLILGIFYASRLRHVPYTD